jgi:hypothetical protein
MNTQRTELVLHHRPEFERFVRATRSCYRVSDPLVLAHNVVGDLFDGLYDGPTGFLSIKSPEAHIEVCTNRAEHALVWDARYLDYLDAYTRIFYPRADDSAPEKSVALREEPAGNLFLLFLLEQLSLTHRPPQLLVAAEIRRHLLDRKLSPSKILGFDFSPLDPHVPLNRSRYIDFIQTGIRYFIIFHEYIHFAERRPGSTLVADASKGIDMMMEGILSRLAQEEVELWHAKGKEAAAQELERLGLPREKRDLDTAIQLTHHMVNTTWYQNAKRSTKEELTCDFFAIEQVFDKYIQKTFETPIGFNHLDVGYLYGGRWIFTHYCGSLEFFGVARRLARSLDEQKPILLFEPEAFGRFYLLNELYMRSLDRFFSEQHPALTQIKPHVIKQLDYWKGWFLRLNTPLIDNIMRKKEEYLNILDRARAQAERQKTSAELAAIVHDLNAYLGWE